MSTVSMTDRARLARSRAARERARRERILRAVREARRATRRLCDEAAQERDMVLSWRWHLWAAGSRPEPPTYVPLSWEAEPFRADPLDAARSECRQTAAALLRLVHASNGAFPRAVIARLPAAIALCETAADRLVARDADAALPLLGAASRMLEELDAAGSGCAAAHCVVLAATCRAAGCGMRRACVHLQGRASPETRPD